MSLTGAGSLLLAEAYAVLSRFDQCLETMRQARAGAPRAAVRVGMFSEFSRARGSTLVAEVRRRYPELLLAVEAVPSSVAVRAVEVGEIELGIVRSVSRRSPVVRRLLGSEPLGACLPAAHPLSASRKIAPARLSGEQLMWMPRSSNLELYDEVLEILAAAGFEANSVESAGTTAATFALIADGYGWGLACQSEVAEATTDHPLAWVPLSGVELVAETWAVWSRKAANPAVAGIVEVLAAVMSTTQPPRLVRSRAS